MNKILRIKRFACALVLILTGATLYASPPPLPTAVLDFVTAPDLKPDTGGNAAALINTMLSTDPEVEMLERSEIQMILNEHEFGLGGNVSAMSAAKIGQLTGAKVLVSGRVFKAGNTVMVVAKVMGTETSRVFGEMVKGGDEEALPDLAIELAEKIKALISANRDKLVAEVTPRSIRQSKLNESLGNVSRPSVSVSIPEEHFGAPVVDPAAETELAAWLLACGFEILDPLNSAEPDYRITGEAFSAFGMRKGNLISCKARVEIKVISSKSQKVIYSDAFTGVAADIAEQTAAKTALLFGSKKRLIL